MSSNEERTCPTCGNIDKGMAYGMAGNPFCSWYRICSHCRTAFFYTGAFIHYKTEKMLDIDNWIIKPRDQVELIKVLLD